MSSKSFSSTVTNDVRLVSKKEFVGAVAKWSIRQSPYSCPDDLQRVVIKADGVWPINKSQNIIEWTYDDFKDFVRNFIDNTPEIQAWGHPKSGQAFSHKFISAYDLPTNPNDDFIDLYALHRNIVADCWNQD